MDLTPEQQAKLAELKELARAAFAIRDWPEYDRIMVEVEKIEPRRSVGRITGNRGNAAGIYRGIKH